MKKMLALITCVSLAHSAAADEFPQFRGPGGLGISNAKNLPIKWSETKNIRWKAKLPGKGLSCPVIAGGRVYVTACSGFEQKRLHVLCFEEKTGKQLWHRQFWATGTTLCHKKTNMAAPTPVTDGTNVYAFFSTFDLVALDRDGNLLWYRSLTSDYPTIGNNVGAAASPVLWNHVLLVPVENAGDSFAIGINKKTGQNIWKVKRHQRVNWVTPLVYDNNGEAEVVFQSITDISGYNPATGAKNWSYSTKKFSTIVTPTVHKGVLYAGGEMFYAIRAGTAKSETELLWEEKAATGYPSPIVYNGRVYALSSRGVLTCVNAKTGKKIFAQRVQGQFSSSPLLADGKIFAIAEDGATSVVQIEPQPRVLSANILPGTFLASPVAANGALFLRSDEYLFCIGKK